METLLSILKKRGYRNTKVLESRPDRILQELNDDRERVFRLVYGKDLKKHGKKTYVEYIFHLVQAENDVRELMIPLEIYYLLTQIKIGAIAT